MLLLSPDGGGISSFLLAPLPEKGRIAKSKQKRQNKNQSRPDSKIQSNPNNLI